MGIAISTWIPPALRWSARIAGLLLAGMVLMFLAGEGPPNLFTEPPSVRVEFFALLLVLAGCLLGWRWECLGGVLGVIGYAAFVITELAVRGKLPGGATPLFAVPGALLLASYGCRRKAWWLAALCVAALTLATPMLLPGVHRARQAGNWATCSSNLSMIGLALLNYDSQYGSLPPAYVADKAGKPLLSWRVLILPFLDRGDLYSQVRLDEPWNSPHNLLLAPLMPRVFRCPADTDAREGETSYVAVVGPGTLWPGAEGRRRPGLGYTMPGTIMVVEAADSGISWMEPRDMPFAVAAKGVVRGAKSGIACRHPCGGGDEPIEGIYSGYIPEAVGYRLFGANCLFADGGSWTVSETVSPQVIAELLTVPEGDRAPGTLIEHTRN